MFPSASDKKNSDKYGTSRIKVFMSAICLSIYFVYNREAKDK